MSVTSYPQAFPVLVQPRRTSTAHLVIAWVLTVLTGFYLLPWAIGATRNKTSLAPTVLVDLFLGWTVVGWVAALILACTGQTATQVVLVPAYPPASHLPPSYPPAGYPADGYGAAGWAATSLVPRPAVAPGPEPTLVLPEWSERDEHHLGRP